MKDKAKRADAHCISKARRRQGISKSARLIDGMMNHTIDCNDAQEQAAVRDGNASFDVLVLQYGEDTMLHTVRPQEEPLRSAPVRCRPGRKRKLSCGRACSFRTDSVCRSLKKTAIDELEGLRRTTLSEWTKSPYIGRELFLLLDRQEGTELTGIQLHYDSAYGLCL